MTSTVSVVPVRVKTVKEAVVVFTDATVPATAGAVIEGGPGRPGTVCPAATDVAADAVLSNRSAPVATTPVPSNTSTAAADNFGIAARQVDRGVRSARPRTTLTVSPVSVVAALFSAFARHPDVGAGAEVHVTGTRRPASSETRTPVWIMSTNTAWSRQPSQVPGSGAASSALISSRSR